MADVKDTAKKATTKVKKTVKKAEVKKDAKKVAKNTKDLMKDLRDLTMTELNASLREAKGDLQKTQKMQSLLVLKIWSIEVMTLQELLLYKIIKLTCINHKVKFQN